MAPPARQHTDLVIAPQTLRIRFRPRSHQPMEQLPTPKLTLPFSITAIAVLAAAVFLWGVEFKCSLYHRHPEKHPPVAVAKLLSEKERPLRNCADNLLRAPLALVVSLAFSLLLTAWHRNQRIRLRAAALMSPALFVGLRVSCLIHFCFRPPPSLVS